MTKQMVSITAWASLLWLVSAKAYGQPGGQIVYSLTVGSKVSYIQMQFSQFNFVYRKTDNADTSFASFSTTLREKLTDELDRKLELGEISFQEYNKFLANNTFRKGTVGSGVVLISSAVSAKERICTIDTLKLVKWQLTDNLDTIAGRACKTAVGTDPNTGNRYVAAYDASIPCSAAPFQFAGLPGLVLQMKNEITGSIIEVVSLKYPLFEALSSLTVCDGCKLVALTKAIEQSKSEAERISELMNRIKNGENVNVKDLKIGNQ